MKAVLVLCILAAVAYADDTYDSKYDTFNADELVENPRLLKSYMNCFLDKGRCTPEGNDFKKVIPEAVRTSCAKCSGPQRQLVRKVIKAFQAKLPQEWSELVKKEDPNGQYTVEFNKFVAGSD